MEGPGDVESPLGVAGTLVVRWSAAERVGREGPGVDKSNDSEAVECPVVVGGGGRSFS